MKAWSGRFEKDTAPAMLRFSESLAEDALLLDHDVAGSIAHARGLERAGVLKPEECRAIVEGLRRVHAKLAKGEAELKIEHEDVHMNVEVLLAAEIGPVAGKLHTARSRNDQVALDLRLWTREALLDLAAALAELEWALLTKGRDQLSLVMPGYTHVQPAQPVTMGHWMHAHAERFRRDVSRALAAFDRTNVSPLGAGALAGTSFPIDPAATAGDLGFDAAFANSIDAVSDRDFAAESLFVASLAGAHLSQLGEELVLWSSAEYAFVELPEEFTTGSSIMPQKRNADSAELARGRAGRAIGDLVNLLTTIKGLPTAYNRDLQETKAPLLRSLPAVAETARVLAAVVRGLTPKPNRIWQALSRGHLAATELADFMAARGVPFRDAHHVVGALVKEADVRGVQLKDFTLAELQKHWPGFTEEARRVLDPLHVPERKISPGGTAPESVRLAIDLSLSGFKVARAAIDARAAKMEKARSLLAS